MKKAVLSILFLAVLLAVAVVVDAQQPKKVPRVGYLSARDSASESVRSEAIRLALRDLGYIEGQTIAVEYRYADNKLDRLLELATELVRLKVDMILVTGGDPDIRATKNATKTIPIIMVGAGTDPVEAGFVDSLARPGGNVTGLTNLGPELGGKRPDLFKETIPKITRVAILYDPALPSSNLQVKNILPVAARALGLTIRSWEVRTANDFERIFSEMRNDLPGGIFVTGGPLLNSNHKQTVGFALKSRLPSLYTTRTGVDSGGLIYYGPDQADSYRRVAYFVDKILKGAKPADLPVERPTKFELAFNLKTAKQIGVTIPQSLLYRADKVIK